MAGFSVNIGADTTQLTAGLNQAAAEVSRFNSALTTAPTQALSTLNNVVQATVAQFDELGASAAALARIEAAIDQAAAAATSAGSRFDTLGGRLPLQDFNRFSASVTKLKTDISSGLLPQISRIPGALNPVTPAADNAANALNRLRPGANQAANALTNVGRVAQDLPFGFIGIQNNLNPLLEGFQRLRAETGSSKAALAALGQSLIGPAGIGIALSVISSAILIYQNGIAGFNKKTKEAKDKAEEFIKTLKSVGDVVGDAAASQSGDIAQVQALANVITNTNNAYGQRKRALEELKEVNKSYFGDLKLEESQMGLLTARVNEYTQAIVAQAVLKGFTDEISRVSVELAKQNRALKTASDNVTNFQSVLDKTKQSETSATGEDRLSAKYVNAKNAVKDANKALIDQFNVVGKLREDYDLLNGEIDGAVKETLRFRDLTKPGAGKAESDGLSKQLSLLEKIRDTAKEFQGKLFDLKDIDAATSKLATLEQQVGDLKLKIALKDAKKAGLPASEIDALQNAIKLDTEKRLNEAFEKEALLLEFRKLKFSQVNRLDINDIIGKVFTSKEKIILTLGENGVDVKMKKESVDVSDLQGKVAKATGLDKTIPIKTPFQIDVQFLGLKGAELKKAKKEIEAQLSESIGKIEFQGKVDLATGLGEALGEALATQDFGSGLKKAAQGMLGIIGGILQQIGKQVITAALAIKALKATLEKFAIANPGLAVVAGIGLVALGAALKNIKFDGPKFATGGIISGPVIGQIGEMHRPEVIMPLDRLPQMLRSIGGGGGNDMELIPIINNEGLYLAVQKGARRAGRKF